MHFGKTIKCIAKSDLRFKQNKIEYCKVQEFVDNYVLYQTDFINGPHRYSVTNHNIQFGSYNQESFDNESAISKITDAIS